jgi:hypothetical protein
MSAFSHGDGLDGSDAAGAILLGIICLAVILFTAYLLVRAAYLVASVLARYPKNPPLWIALATCIVTWVLAGVAVEVPKVINPQQVTVLFAVAGVSSLALLITAKVVELANDPLFQRERTGAMVLDDVVHPTHWWGDEAA